MKLATYYSDGREKIGLIQDGLLYPIDPAKTGCQNMLALIENFAGQSDYLQGLAAAGGGLALAQIELAAPIPRPRHDLICLGMNYLEHAIETARFKGIPYEEPSHVAYFSKRVYRALGQNEAIPNHQELTSQLDYEVELAIVIGKHCVGASRENAFDYVFGYTIANDVSARDLQLRHGGQFYYSKSLEGFSPMGPWIVTADEIADPQKLKICSRVNGQLRQNSDTSQLIFDIPHIISELSAAFTLEPGDLIITGTPSGVGMGFDPPRYLCSKDVIECEIEGIGVLRNTIA